MPHSGKKKWLPPILDSTINQLNKWSRDNSSLEKTEHDVIEKVMHGNPKISEAKTRAGHEGEVVEKKSKAIDPDRIDVLYGLGKRYAEKCADIFLDDKKTVNVMEKVKDRKDKLKDLTDEERAEI